MHQYFAYGSTTLLLFSFQLAIKSLKKKSSIMSCCCRCSSMHDYEGSTTINAPIAHVAAQFPGDVKAEWFGGMASCVDLDVIADQPTAVSQQPAGPFKVYEVSAHHVLQIRLSSVSGSNWPGRGSTPGGGIAPLWGTPWGDSKEEEDVYTMVFKDGHSVLRATAILARSSSSSSS
jgi:hypothetical protein